MANPDHREILKQGVIEWNKWRKAHPGVQPDLSDLKFPYKDLSGADLSRVDLSRATLSRATLARANLAEANLCGAIFSEATLVGANFSDSDLTKANLTKADLSRADLSRVTLTRATLTRATLTEANLCEALFSKATLSGATLSGADLHKAKLSNADLAGANLSGANLAEATFFEANLTRASLAGANLSAAMFAGANCFLANFSGAKLTRAKFSGTDLFGANLSVSILFDADFSDSDLTDVSFIDASFNKTIFANRAALNNLAKELTSDQLAGCVFRAEYSTRSSKEETSFEGLPLIYLHFDAPVWTPFYASSALITAQLAINRVQYLLTTEENSPERLEHALKTPCFPGDFTQTIRLAGINEGSLEIFLGYIKKAVSPKAFRVLLITGSLVAGIDSLSGSYCKIQEGQKHAAEASKLAVESEKIKLEMDELRTKNKTETRLALPSSTTPCHLPSSSTLPSSLIYSKVTTEFTEPRSFGEPLREEHIKVPHGFSPVSEEVGKSPGKYLTLAVQPMYSFISTHFCPAKLEAIAA